MSILMYIIIALFSIALIITALFYLAKGLFALMCWFLRLLPTIIKTIIYWLIAVLGCSILEGLNILPELPFALYPLLYLVIIGFILVRRFVNFGSIFQTSSGNYKGYVLNKKSKVIHDKYSDSEETISPKHRKELSYSEATELINNNKKYHFKQDS